MLVSPKDRAMLVVEALRKPVEARLDELRQDPATCSI